MAKVTGRGSIRPQEEGYRCRKWRLYVTLGKDPMTKERIQKSRRFEGTKREAEAELKAYINELESGIRIDSMDLTFSEYAERWLKERESTGELKKGTYRKNDQHIKALNMHIGDVKLVDITPTTIKSVYQAFREGKSASGRPLANTSIRCIAITFGAILTAAVDEEIILRNPHDKVKKPKVDTEEKKALTKDEARRLIWLLNDGDPNSHTIGALLALTCGLRRAEVLGLRWCDFDKEKRSIQVVRTLSADGREVKTTKTKAGRRTIPLDEVTAKRLEDWRVVQSTYFISIGLPQTNERYIVSSTTGGNMHPENLARWWKKYSKKNGLSGYSLHQLRHTYATLLVAQGTDIVTAKTLMGHTDTKMLTELYAHLVPENASKAADMIGNTLYADEDTESKVIEFEGTAKTA